MLSADGSQVRRLDRDPVPNAERAGGDNHPSWSPTGRQIAFSRSLGARADGTIRKEIHVVDSDGSRLKQVTALDGYSWFPAWAPDGARLAFVHGNAVATLDLRTGAVTRLTSGYGPAWSPDGKMIAFTSDRSFGCYYRPDEPAGDPHCYSTGELYVMRSDGTDQQRITDEDDVDFRTPHWSPDGRFLTAGCRPFVCLIDLRDRSVRRLPTAQTDEPLPAFSPDGRTIAFSTGSRSTGFELRRIGIDGTGEARIRSGIDPEWESIASAEPASETPPPPRHVRITPCSRRSHTRCRYRATVIADEGGRPRPDSKRLEFRAGHVLRIVSTREALDLRIWLTNGAGRRLERSRAAVPFGPRTGPRGRRAFRYRTARSTDRRARSLVLRLRLANGRARRYSVRLRSIRD